jgi:hypothetical protein
MDQAAGAEITAGLSVADQVDGVGAYAAVGELLAQRPHLAAVVLPGAVEHQRQVRQIAADDVTVERDPFEGNPKFVDRRLAHPVQLTKERRSCGEAIGGPGSPSALT